MIDQDTLSKYLMVGALLLALLAVLAGCGGRDAPVESREWAACPTELLLQSEPPRGYGLTHVRMTIVAGPVGGVCAGATVRAEGSRPYLWTQGDKAVLCLRNGGRIWFARAGDRVDEALGWHDLAYFSADRGHTGQVKTGLLLLDMETGYVVLHGILSERGGIVATVDEYSVD